MKQKRMLQNLKKALQQDFLYSSEELTFMREQLKVLQSETRSQTRKKPEGFGK